MPQMMYDLSVYRIRFKYDQKHTNITLDYRHRVRLHYIGGG
jgi:hypothetical protein